MAKGSFLLIVRGSPLTRKLPQFVTGSVRIADNARNRLTRIYRISAQAPIP